jgi:hypothetical protein
MFLDEAGDFGGDIMSFLTMAVLGTFRSFLAEVHAGQLFDRCDPTENRTPWPTGRCVQQVSKVITDSLVGVPPTRDWLVQQ